MGSNFGSERVPSAITYLFPLQLLVLFTTRLFTSSHSLEKPLQSHRSPRRFDRTPTRILLLVSDELDKMSARWQGFHFQIRGAELHESVK
ncbi:hypothetical protein AKJ16_DCAP13816, partial [Drosera capensis]